MNNMTVMQEIEAMEAALVKKRSKKKKRKAKLKKIKAKYERRHQALNEMEAQLTDRVSAYIYNAIDKAMIDHDRKLESVEKRLLDLEVTDSDLEVTGTRKPFWE